MENNDSPKALKSGDETKETIEDIVITIPDKKKQNKTKRKKKSKKYLQLFGKEVNNLKIINNNKTENLIIYNTHSKYYKFVGKSLFLFMDKYDNPLLIVGPHWPLFACFFGIVNILYMIIIFKLWNRLGPKSKLVNQISYWLFTLSYAYTSLINPGYPKNNNERKTGYPREDYFFCNDCKFYVKRNTGATHCEDCGICIEGQDHHCPWTSHCVGKNNIITFYIFIVSTLFSIGYLPLVFCQFLK